MRILRWRRGRDWRIAFFDHARARWCVIYSAPADAIPRWTGHPMHVPPSEIVGLGRVWRRMGFRFSVVGG